MLTALGYVKILIPLLLNVCDSLKSIATGTFSLKRWRNSSVPVRTEHSRVQLLSRTFLLHYYNSVRSCHLVDESIKWRPKNWKFRFILQLLVIRQTFKLICAQNCNISRKKTQTKMISVRRATENHLLTQASKQLLGIILKSFSFISP